MPSTHCVRSKNSEFWSKSSGFWPRLTKFAAKSMGLAAKAMTLTVGAMAAKRVTMNTTQKFGRGNYGTGEKFAA